MSKLCRTTSVDPSGREPWLRSFPGVARETRLPLATFYRAFSAKTLAALLTHFQREDERGKPAFPRSAFRRDQTPRLSNLNSEFMVEFFRLSVTV